MELPELRRQIISQANQVRSFQLRIDPKTKPAAPRERNLSTPLQNPPSPNSTDRPPSDSKTSFFGPPVAMFLQRSAALVARRAAVPVAPVLRRSFATTIIRRDAQVPDKAATAPVQKLSGRSSAR